METLKKYINPKKLGLIFSLALIGFALFILYKKLKGVSWDKIAFFMAETPTSALFYAGLFVVGAYFTLTFYDFFAVRTIGRTDISYKTAATASFTSYSIAHNLGFTFITAGVVRFLVYSPHGLSVGDVVRVVIIAGLTFWLGNAAVLGLGFMLEPQALEPLFSHLNFSATTIRYLGLAIILALVFYVYLMNKGKVTLGKGDLSVTLPDGKLTFAQILLGIVDLTFCAGIMYVLMPKGIGHVPFVELMVIFVASMLLGFASHAPGGMGAFEASMLIGLPEMDKEQLIAALLLYRIYYFLIPFTLALIVMFFREFIFGGGSFAHIKESIAEIKQVEKSK
jgi:glycosyltransferase 2 family protein